MASTVGRKRHLNRMRRAVFTIAIYGLGRRDEAILKTSDAVADVGRPDGFRWGASQVAIAERQFTASYTSRSIWAIRFARYAFGIKRARPRPRVFGEVNPAL